MFRIRVCFYFQVENLMRTICLSAALVILSIGGAAPTLADESPDHFKGLVPESPTEAVQNFSRYNDKLENILARDSLSVTDMAEIHEITYTLENALAVINEQTANVASLLETLHLASELGGADNVVRAGREYLNRARQIAE